MVLDVGGLGDRSFNDSAYAGLVRARDRLGVEIKVLDSRSAADYQPNLTVLANEDYDEIFAVGYLMNRDLHEVALHYPKRWFSIIDAVVNEPNVASVTFREQDGSFLAGALAAMVSKTHTVAFLGGVDIPLLRKFEAGFFAGAREVDPKVRTLVKYAGSFEDVAAGKELANVLFDQGADIVYVAAGKTGLGAIEAVKPRKNDFVIGVDADQDGLAPGRVLTSVIKRVDVGVFRIAQDVVAQKPPSGPVVLGLRDDAISLTDFKYTRKVIGAQHLATLAKIRKLIVSGRIDPPSTREGLERFRPVPL